jgi:MGT family glycosyltransferase
MPPLFNSSSLMQTEIRQQVAGKRVLFATIPADGHVNPLTGFAKYLQQAGCDVRWYTSAIYADKLLQLAIPHYAFEQARDINGQNLDAELPERKMIDDPAEKLDFDSIHLYCNRAPEYYRDLQEIHQLFPFELLIADNAFSASPLVRHGLGIPVVVIGVLPLVQDSINLPPYGMALPPAHDAASRAKYRDMKDFVATVLFKKSIDTYAAVLQAHGISAQRATVFKVLVEQANLFLQIGLPSFEYERSDLGDNVRFVGALLPYAAQTQREPWFDEQINRYQHVLLVTQGTVENDARKLLEPALEAFKDTEYLVITTSGGSGTSALRAKFPQENIIIEASIPFGEVMPHATAYVSNGGYGGVLLALQHGLPVVAAGVHEGKNAVCARIGYFNYGLDLQTETPTAAQLREAVEKVTTDRCYAENVARLAEELRSFDANAVCAQYVAQVLQTYSDLV